MIEKGKRNMKMTKDKLDAFCEMMTKELGKVNCCAGFDTDPEYCRTNIIVENRNHVGTQYYAVNWKEVRSLTEAAVPILVDIKTRLNSEVKNDLYKYVENDIEQVRNLYYGLSLSIKDVIFNPPATIVFWMDGTKTDVKEQEAESASSYASTVLGDLIEKFRNSLAKSN